MTDDQAGRLTAAGFRRTAIKTGRDYPLWELRGRLHSAEAALAKLEQTPAPAQETHVVEPNREKDPEPERVQLPAGVAILAAGWGDRLNVPAWIYTRGRYSVRAVYTLAGPVSPAAKLAVRYDRDSRTARASAIELYQTIVGWGYSNVLLEKTP